jgi:hypothetical protein
MSGRFFTFVYCVANLLWLALPLCFSAVIVPEIMGFTLALGEEGAETKYYRMIILGYVVAAITAGFLVWHFLIKRRRTPIVKNKMFILWIAISYFILSSYLALNIPGPVFTGSSVKENSPVRK